MKAPRHYLYEQEDTWTIRSNIPESEICTECGEWGTIEHGDDEEHPEQGTVVSYYRCTTPGCWTDYETEWMPKEGYQRQGTKVP